MRQIMITRNGGDEKRQKSSQRAASRVKEREGEWEETLRKVII